MRWSAAPSPSAMVPSVESVRLVNSGTEATMSAVRLARAATGRRIVLKFEGCYHGHADSFLIQAGSGAATFGEPSSPGVTPGTASDTRNAAYNDLDSVRAVFTANPGAVACVIVEPVAGNMGCVPPEPGFLEGLREITSADGALLIFDEVMTGFRVAKGGAQERYGITPDLTTHGKIIGGGLPVGAYGGRRDLMEQLAPLGPVYQAGTLSGNPVAMAAGAATLRRLFDDDGAAWDQLDRTAGRLQEGIEGAFRSAGLPFSVARVGSILWLSLQEGPPPRRFEDIEPGVAGRYAALHAALLEEGVYMAPSAYEVMFVSTAHDDGAIDETVAAFVRAVGRVS